MVPKAVLLAILVMLQNGTQVARYIATAMRRGRSEGEVRKNAEKILTTTKAITMKHQDNT